MVGRVPYQRPQIVSRDAVSDALIGLDNGFSGPDVADDGGA
jgi:hypothetical protein